MCGIAGFVGRGSIAHLERMVAAQIHRGPDDGGTWIRDMDRGPQVGLGSRRLAILDLTENGHMPMVSEDGQVVLTFNGEIYNYLDLKKDLEQRGYRFRSSTDTEVVLQAYCAFGPDFVRRLNGMFAFALWDERRQQLLLARDHFGIKPLYYAESEGSFAFASEVKSLVHAPNVSTDIDHISLSQYLSFLWVPEPRTIFKSIHKLPAGCTAIVSESAFEIQRYWNLQYPPKAATATATETSGIDEESIARELRERLFSTIRRQTRSDVEVGAFLSAGLDSSCIIAAMSEAGESPVKTFTIGFPKDKRRGEVYLDDTDVAARTADHFGCDHREIVVDANVVDLLPKLTYHMDEPVADPAIISAFLVNEAASEHTTVLMSGIGGDELFGGYLKYRAHYLAQSYQRIPRSVRAGVIEPSIRSLPSLRGTPLKGYVRLAKKMARSAGLPPQERFVTDSVYLSDEQKSVLCSDWYDDVRHVDPRQVHLQWFEDVRDADFLHQMMYVDSKTFLPSLNLLYNDKMSMASSVEVRVPFLDWQFAEWAATNVPPGMKLNGSSGKYILRRALKGVLPDEVLTQPKAAFGAPIDAWLASDLREMVEDVLAEDRVRSRGWFDPTAIRRLVDQHRSGRHDWSAQIWQLLTFELWQQQFEESALRMAA